MMASTAAIAILASGAARGGLTSQRLLSLSLTVTIFRHRDAPERLDRSETELNSEGSIFNAFHTLTLPATQQR